MGELSSLLNISKAKESKLNGIDIFTKNQLIVIGSKDAFVRIRTHDPDACINMLCAIEGIRWHNPPDSKKAELKEFHSKL